jgi:6-phosphofructokinase
MSIRTIGVANSGADCPGLNAAIRGAMKTAICKYDWRAIDIPNGFDGLIWPAKCSQITLSAVGGGLPPTVQNIWRHPVR